MVKFILGLLMGLVIALLLAVSFLIYKSEKCNRCGAPLIMAPLYSTMEYHSNDQNREITEFK